MILNWKNAAKEYKRAFDYAWDSYQDLGREWANGSDEYEAKIKALEAENAALRENESRLAFHVVPELEEQLRAADKLADATEEHVECSTCADSDCCARAVDHRDAREAACLALSAYLTARGKK